MKPLPLALYRVVTDLAAGPIHLYLRARQRRGKEDAARLGERLGRPHLPRPSGRVVWIHGASVGESLSALPLAAELLRRHADLHVLMTTGTVTSARLLPERLPQRAVHQYVPVDRAAWARAFLDHWRPDLVLWLESELWPNLLAEVAARRLPAVLVNARMSERSYRRWSGLAPAAARRLLSSFALCLAQSEADAERLRRLGAGPVGVPGNLKLAAPPLPVDTAALDALRAAVGERPVWLAASTHDGEERIAASLHRRLAARHPGLLTIVVPRHPERGPAVVEAVRGLGLGVTRRGAGEPPTQAIHIADTMGELGLFYRLARIVFIGKSLTGRGGQNPLEPARLGCAVLCGPHMDNFAEVAAALEAAGGLRRVADEDALAAAVDDLLADGEARRRQGEAARRVAEAEAGVLARVVAAIEPLLPQTAVTRRT